MIPLDDAFAAPRGCSGPPCTRAVTAGGYYEQGQFATAYGQPNLPGEAGLLGPDGEVQRRQARLDERHGRLPERRRQSASAAPCPASPTSSCRSWTSHRAPRSSSRASGTYGGGWWRRLRKITEEDAGQGTEVAAHRPRTDHRLPAKTGRGPRDDQDRRGAGQPGPRRQRRHRHGLGPDHPHRGQAWASTPASTSSRRKSGSATAPRRSSAAYSIFMKGKDPRDAHFINQPDLRHLRGQPRDVLGVHAEHGLRHRPAAPGRVDHQLWRGPPSTCSTTTSSRRTSSGWTTANGWSKRPNPGVLELANRTEAAHAGEHGYKTIGDIMRSLNPLEGDFYREALQVSRYTREMFCLMEGRHVHPSTLYPGWGGHGGHGAAVHRLPDPADALHRVPQEGRAVARRPVRLLLRGVARLRARRRAAHPARLLGQPQRPRVLRLQVSET